MNENPENFFPLEEVPDLVLLCIAKHLSTDDARNLSNTCKRFKDILPNYPLPLTIFKDIKEFCSNIFFKSSVLKSTVERIDMSMKWYRSDLMWTLWGPYHPGSGQVWLQLLRPGSPFFDPELITQMKPKRCDVDEDYQFYVDTLTQNEKIVKLAKPG